MSEFEMALEQLRAERAQIEASIEQLDLRGNLLDAEIRGMERARDLLAPMAVHTGGRIAVQGPVMALFNSDYQRGSEAEIIAATGLPVASVHKFLVRAIQKKLLYRLDGGDYAVWGSVKQEAAE